MNVDDGSTRTPAFLKVNRNGKVPAVVLEDGTSLVGIGCHPLFYFAEGTPFWPAAKLTAPGSCNGCSSSSITTNRPSPWCGIGWRILGKTPANEPLLPAKVAAGYRALDVMEDHLGRHAYFVGKALFDCRHRALCLYPCGA